MNLTRLLAVASKEMVQILRDSRSLVIVVIMPVTLMLLFGYGVNLDLKGLPVYVYDQDGSQQSQDSAQALPGQRVFPYRARRRQLFFSRQGARLRRSQDGPRDSVEFFPAA